MNKWIGIGRCTKKPELSYTPSGTAKCVFSIAVEEGLTKEGKKEVDYPRIIVWGRTAEACDRYLDKGSQCAIIGKIKTGSYQNQQGNTVYTTDVWAERVKFLDTRNRESENVPPTVVDNDIPFTAVDDAAPF